MRDKKNVIVSVGQHGIAGSVTRQIAITEKLLKRIKSRPSDFYMPQEKDKEPPRQKDPGFKTEQMTETEYLDKISELMEKNDKLGLLDLAIRWTQAQPEYTEPWYFLGITYSESGQTAKAIEAYQQAIRFNPNYAEAWYNLGNSYDDTDQSVKAIEAYQQAVRANPNYTSAWYNLGVVYLASGQKDKTMETYKKLKRIDPVMADAFYNNVFRTQNHNRRPD